MEHVEQNESTSNSGPVFVAIVGIVLLLTAAVTIVLNSDGFLLMMIGVPFCLITSIGLGFWASTANK
ncbi:MAG: hypothetical protein COB22_06270 [Cycloclasticus sp.]|nr:MAG: hypothetical protein COB22_06270 [Cycloclasticus sp.]